MAKDTKKKGVVHLKVCRQSFASLFKPKASIEGGPEKFRLNALIDPNTSVGQENIKKIEFAKKEIELEVFGKSPMKYKEDRCCFVDGDDCTDKETGEPYLGYKGMKVLRCTNERAPAVVDKNPAIALDKDDPIPYNGCYINLYARLYGMNDAKKGGPGLFCSFDIVQFAKDGEPFGAVQVDPTTVMDTVEDDDDDGTTAAPAPAAARKAAATAPAAEEDDDEDLLAGI
jgi:hypothetical protein